MNTEDTGRRIRAARELREMTQSELGRAVGYSYHQIGKIERGERRLPIGKLEQIAAALGVTVEHILGRSAQDAKGETMNDVRQYILMTEGLPAGLVELADSSNITAIIGITDLEWRILLSLAEAWPDAELVPRDGWISILYSLRAAGRTEPTVTKS